VDLSIALDSPIHANVTHKEMSPGHNQLLLRSHEPILAKGMVVFVTDNVAALWFEYSNNGMRDRLSINLTYRIVLANLAERDAE